MFCLLAIGIHLYENRHQQPFHFLYDKGTQLRSGRVTHLFII